jgi:hypothetical protein
MTTVDKVIDLCCWAFIILIAIASLTLALLSCSGVIYNG